MLLGLCATFSGLEDFVEFRLWGDERMDFDLLFCWFVGLGVDDAVWDALTF